MCHGVVVELVPRCVMWCCVDDVGEARRGERLSVTRCWRIFFFFGYGLE